MHQKDAEGIANSVDPDQTAPRNWLGGRGGERGQGCYSISFLANLLIQINIFVGVSGCKIYRF